MSMSGEGMGRRLGRMAIMGMDQKIVLRCGRSRTIPDGPSRKQGFCRATQAWEEEKGCTVLLDGRDAGILERSHGRARLVVTRS